MIVLPLASSRFLLLIPSLAPLHHTPFLHSSIMNASPSDSTNMGPSPLSRDTRRYLIEPISAFYGAVTRHDDRAGASSIFWGPTGSGGSISLLVLSVNIPGGMG